MTRACHLPSQPIRPHQRFSRRLTLSVDQVRDQAVSLGDHNPIHHDLEYARARGFDGLVASGGQTSALLMGLAASHFQAFGLMLGVEFSMRFLQPVYAGQELQLEWLVIRIRERADGHDRGSTRGGSSGHGHSVDLRGRIRSVDGVTRLGARGRVLVYLQ